MVEHVRVPIPGNPYPPIYFELEIPLCLAIDLALAHHSTMVRPVPIVRVLLKTDIVIDCSMFGDSDLYQCLSEWWNLYRTQCLHLCYWVHRRSLSDTYVTL